MKKIALLILSLYLISCQNNENRNVDYEILSGQIKNAPANQFILRDLQNQKVAAIQLDSLGNFSDTLHLPKSYYKLNLGNQYTWLYLKPGYNLHMQVDYNDFDKSLSFQGEGAENNNYLAAKMLKGIEMRPKTAYQYYGQLDEKAFVRLQDSIYNVYDKLLQQVDDKEFADLEKFRNQFNKSSYLSKYEMVRRYLTHDNSFKVSKDFPQAFEADNLNDERFLKIPQGVQILSEYMTFKIAGKKNGQDVDPYERMQMIAEEIKNPKLRETLALREGKYNLLYTKHMEDFYRLFDQLVQNDSLKKPVKEKYDNLKSMLPGAPSPDFTAYDINGKEYHLKDFAGKALYIDLWATWCAPCKAEIPFLDKIKEQYKGKPVNFLSLDVYDKKDKWEQMLKQQKLSGWQLINTNREMPFLKKYVVDGIPRFILLDKDGKIVDANAPRPSSGKTLTELIDKTIGK